MATRIEYAQDLQPSAQRPQPLLTLVHDAGNYDDLERSAPGIAARGVHRSVLGALVGFYGAMLLSFWTFFARDPHAAFALAAVTVLMIMYFALVVGGIALADTPAPGERQRGFAEFLRGPVDILTGVVTGREVLLQMLFLPACMVVLATIIGCIARSSQ